MSAAFKLAIGSLVVGGVVLVLKLLAWWMTGSVALLSDALESTVNLATALAALIAIHIAARPADANHPFGHQKAEFFSAVLEGVMIVVAAVFILREAWGGFLNPRAIDAPIEGLLVNGIATAVNAVWAWVLVHRGGRLRSPALVADGRHLWADVLTSAGVVLGVLLALITGWWVLDPVMAALVAVNILWSGARIVKESLSGLMDEAVPDAMLERIRQIIAAEAEGALEAHDLRTATPAARLSCSFIWWFPAPCPWPTPIRSATASKPRSGRKFPARAPPSMSSPSRSRSKAASSCWADAGNGAHAIDAPAPGVRLPRPS